MPTFCKVSLMLLAVAACGQGSGGGGGSPGTGVGSRTIADEPSAVIDAERGRILGVAIAMPEDTLIGVLGQPIRTGADLADTSGTRVLEFPMGTVRIRGRQGVVGFLCGGDECRTPDGVGIGDSSDVILSTYGPTPPRGPLEAPEALDYRLGSTDCNLTFTLASGRVTSLELGCATR